MKILLRTCQYIHLFCLLSTQVNNVLCVFIPISTVNINYYFKELDTAGRINTFMNRY